MDDLRRYIEKNDIGVDDMTVCSDLNTLNYDSAVQGLVEANVRLILPDFVYNPRAKEIYEKVLQIMVENAINTNKLTAYAIVNKLI